MMGSFLTRALILVLGYAYPAYDCYKTVELNKPEIGQLRFWCQYWILVALLTVFERVADAFISWLPMYSEAKLAFIVYLWFPKTKGTTYVYDSFFRPYIAKHETEIDRNLLELRTRAGDMAVLYCQRAVNYGQTRVFEVLQYVASQSHAPRTHPVQQQQQQSQDSRQAPPAVLATRPSASSPQKQQLARAPPSPSKSQVQENTATVGVPSSPSQLQASSGPSRHSPSNSEAEANSHVQLKEEPMQVDTASSSANEESHPPPGETVMEEAIRVTRGRLRKRMSAAGPST